MAIWQRKPSTAKLSWMVTNEVKSEACVSVLEYVRKAESCKIRCHHLINLCCKGLLWHSDRGSQYAADSHRKIIKNHHLIQSQSRKGDCWDNAVAESFFHTFKSEALYQQKFKTRDQAKQQIFEYIEVFYNRIRMHSSIGYLSPVQFEDHQQLLQKSA